MGGQNGFADIVTEQVTVERCPVRNEAALRAYSPDLSIFPSQNVGHRRRKFVRARNENVCDRSLPAILRDQGIGSQDQWEVWI